VKRGFSLLEVLVAAGLLGLLLVLTFGYLLPAAKAAYRYQTRGHLQQTALVALSLIEAAADTTSPAGVSWSKTSPIAIGFNPVDALQPSNAILTWTDRYEIFWWDETERTLKLTEWPPSPPSPTTEESSTVRAKRLPPERLSEIIETATKTRTLAYGVTNFTVDHPGAEDTLIQPVTITIELTELGREDRDDAQKYSHSLTFRTTNRQ
jgi:prepilin-type N-terminal cleavage/methylation domain-containing protein